MKASKRGLDFIKQEEEAGKPALKAYKDIAGIWTIGYGHAYVDKDMVITAEEAEAIFEADVAKKSAWIDKLVTVPLTQGQYDALASFVFNLGEGALRSSRLLKNLNNGHYQHAADEFVKWCKYKKNGVLTLSPGLLGRRKREVKLWNTPD